MYIIQICNKYNRNDKIIKQYRPMISFHTVLSFLLHSISNYFSLHFLECL